MTAPAVPPPANADDPPVAPTPAQQQATPAPKNYKWGFMAGFSLPESNDDVKAIRYMRKIGLTNIAFIVSTFDDAVETNLPIFANVGSGNTVIQKGLSFVAWIPVEDLLTKYKLTQPLRTFAPAFMDGLGKANPLKSVMFRANVSAATIGEFTLEGELNFNERMALSVKGTEVAKLSNLRLELSVSPAAQTADISIAALWSMLIDPTQKKPLDFYANMFVKPGVDGSVTLGVTGAMLSSWENIYGLPGISFNSLKFKCGLSFATATSYIPIPDDLFLTGQMKYGQLVGDVTMAINYNQLSENMVLARFCQLSFANVIDQFLSGMVKTKFGGTKNTYINVLNDFLNMELKDVYLKVVPPNAPTNLMAGLRLEADYTQSCNSSLKLADNWIPGIRMAADGKFAGWNGYFDIGVEGSLSSLSGGLTLKGKMDPIKISANGFKIFHLSGFKETDPFELYADLSTNSLINGVKGLLSDPNSSKSTSAILNTSSPFYIIAKHSGKAIDIAGASKDMQAKVQQLTKNNSAGQQFVFEPFGEGYYTIRNVNSNMDLDVQNGLGNNGQPVWQYLANTTPAQLFKLVPKENGVFEIESNLNPTLVMDITGSSNTDGAQLSIRTRNGGANQQFQLITVEANTQPVSSTTDRIFYLSGGLTILEVAQAKTFIELTPEGYKFQARGKLYKFADGTIDATIGSFRDILNTTTVNARVDVGAIMQKIYDKLGSSLGDIPFFNELKKGFVLKSISFGGKLAMLQSSATASIVFKIAGQSYNPNFTISMGSSIDVLVNTIVDKIKETATGAINIAKKTFYDAIDIAKRTATELKNTATAATTLFTNTAKDAINKANELKGKLASVAGSAYTSTKDAFTQLGKKTQDFFVDFGKYTGKTIEKIFNKTVDKLENGWGSFTSAMKKTFTGSDNEERILTDGPAFRIMTKYQNNILASTLNMGNNWPVAVRPRNAANSFLETWQLIPNDKSVEGSFFLVSGYSGLLIADPLATHSTLIPHESDHKDRERMLMEAVPNEPGWYYLKYRELDGKTNSYKYVEVKNQSLSDVKNAPGFQAYVAQWVLAPVAYIGNNRPGDMGKFRFEKAGDIDWQKLKATNPFPPSMALAAPLQEGGRYQFNGEPEQYIYTNGSFRWIPDYETLVAFKFDAKPLVTLPNNQQVSTVLGPQYPTRKNGALVQAQNEPAIFIMENGLRRWIPDGETFTMMGLNGGMVQFVSKADLTAIPAGDDIPSKFIPKTVLTEKAIYMQVGGNGTVYVVLNKTLRGIPNLPTLQAMGYDGSQILHITAQDLNSLPIGPLLPDRQDGMLLQADQSSLVYIMQSGIRRHVPDVETFNSMNLDWNKVQKVSAQDLELIPAGPALLSLK